MLRGSPPAQTAKGTTCVVDALLESSVSWSLNMPFSAGLNYDSSTARRRCQQGKYGKPKGKTGFGTGLAENEHPFGQLRARPIQKVRGLALLLRAPCHRG